MLGNSVHAFFIFTSGFLIEQYILYSLKTFYLFIVRDILHTNLATLSTGSHHNSLGYCPIFSISSVSSCSKSEFSVKLLITRSLSPWLSIYHHLGLPFMSAKCSALYLYIFSPSFKWYVFFPYLYRINPFAILYHHY